MPPCSTCSATFNSVLRVSRSTAKAGFPSTSHLSWSYGPVTTSKGFASSSTSHTAFSKSSNAFPSQRHEALTLLHKITKIFPRIQDATRPSGFPQPEETSTFWDGILSTVYEDLAATSERPVKILVCGLDERTDLVTALLSEPLSSDEAQTGVLANRWKDPTQEKLEIYYDAKLNSEPSKLLLPSSYLIQFLAPVEITELRPLSAQTFKSDASITQRLQENPAIFEADIPIIHCNPLTIPLSAVLNAQLPSNAIIVLTSSVPQADLDATVQNHFRSCSFQPPTIIAADPRRAVDAIHTLQSDPNSLSAIQRFQADFVGSRISSITAALQNKLALDDGSDTVRSKLARGHIQDVLRWSFASVHQVGQDIDKAYLETSHLKERIEEALARVEGDVFVRCGYDHKTVLDEVDEAIKLAEKDMQPIINWLTWWRMVWRVDEISNIVGTGVTRTWCRDLERKLILHTGRLSALQRDTTESAMSLVSAHPTLSTAVLRNTLLQLQRTPNYALAPESLTQPIHSRRNLILEFPTTRLHATGQRAVLGMTGGIVTGVGISWAGWLGWFLGSGEGLLGYVGMETGTAVGVGVLSAVTSIRWAVGQWEKSKKRWWQDWKRVAEGMNRDLRLKLHTTMRQQVVVVADKACDEMSTLIAAREEGLEEVVKELKEEQTGLERINGRTKEKP